MKKKNRKTKVIRKTTKAKKPMKKTARKKLSGKKNPPSCRTGMFNYRMNPKEERLIRSNAKKFANGQVATWVKYAAINHNPKQRAA